MTVNFESALERLGRIMARQYHINVKFDGGNPRTNGDTIYLPRIENLTRELYNNLSSFLDHEVGHCKFTEFGQLAKTDSRFHSEMLNATEDSRIENEMIREFPGTESTFAAMNERLLNRLYAEWDEIPITIRVIHDIRMIMDGKTPRLDSDAARYVEAVRGDAVALNNCTTTEEMRVATAAICEKIKELRMEENRPDEGDDQNGEKGEDQEGEGQGRSAPTFPDEEKESSKSQGSGEKEDSQDSEDQDSQGGQSKQDGKSEDQNSQFDQMLNEQVGKDGSEYDNHVRDAASMISEELEDHIKTPDHVIKTLELCDEFNSNPHIPITTQFDREIDNTKDGDASEYGSLFSEIKPHVRPIVLALERVLKVQQKTKWRSDRERGDIDVRTLARLATDKNFRRPFKDRIRNQTQDVAVELLVDMSGSMGGAKIRLAQQAAIAMGEALKTLGIAFEATGFHTESDNKVKNAGRGEDEGRYNRTEERLDHHIFKSFDSDRMIGLTKIEAYGNNTDNESVAWAVKRIMARNEKRKIMIVFSDGHPNCFSDHGIMNADLKRVIKRAVKAGVEMVGIGIHSDAVERFYPDHIVLNDISSLPREVMKKLARMLQSGIAA